MGLTKKNYDTCHVQSMIEIITSNDKQIAGPELNNEDMYSL